MTSFAPARPRSVGGRVLRAAAALTTPLLPQDYLGLVDPLLGTRDLRGRVERVVPETEDSATLVIRPGWGWRPHRAGQWVTVGVRIDGVWYCRAYSVSSAAGAERRFAVTVKAPPGGRVSTHRVHATGPEIGRPAGG